MIVDSIEIATKIAVEYKRRLTGQNYSPDSKLTIENVYVSVTKGGKYGVYMEVSDGVTINVDVPFQNFIDNYKHPFDYNKFGLSAPMK
jgi:hypothetical protein